MTYISSDLSVWLCYTPTDSLKPVDIEITSLSVLLPHIDVNTKKYCYLECKSHSKINALPSRGYSIIFVYAHYL